jgi:hypothetical protein
MPNVFGQDVVTVREITDAFRRHGDSMRVTYRAIYEYERGARDPYACTRLERPAALVGNPPGITYPWEQIFVAAAGCAGSDYPMLAQHENVTLDRVEFVVEGVLDPRGEFDGLDGFAAPMDAARCYLALHLKATLTSGAPAHLLERMHRRVIERNMVLGALRGIPLTHELMMRPS